MQWLSGLVMYGHVSGYSSLLIICAVSAEYRSCALDSVASFRNMCNNMVPYEHVLGAGCI